jgi:hypothetical protein
LKEEEGDDDDDDLNHFLSFKVVLHTGGTDLFSCHAGLHAGVTQSGNQMLVSNIH